LAVLTSLARADDTVIRLKVQPMPAPRPALKYQLLPEVREMHPGNPAQWYVRCFQEQRNFFFSREATAERARYRSMPLAELPAEQLRHYGGHALTQADWAARSDALDWQVLERVQNEGMDLMLPELGPLRILATALQVRFRAQVAGGHFDEAVGTAKTMFALARHLGEYPAEAAGLLGISVADLALDTLDETVQQPGCPNLYWALTDLPIPLVELRTGLQGHRAQVEAEFRLLRDDRPMTETEIEEVVSRLSGRIGFAREQAGESPRNVRAALKARASDAKQVRSARDRLLEAGLAEGLAAGSGLYLAFDLGLRLQSFPPMQVILLGEKRAYELRRDDDLKLLALAPWQIDALVSRKEQKPGGDAVFADFLPNVPAVRRAQARLEQRIALLRHVEALRLYAAAHEGRVPETLADVGVPLPADPFTGKAFVYQVHGATARLGARPPRREEKNRVGDIQYEITVQK
jgi:hypothetical protein